MMDAKIWHDHEPRCLLGVLTVAVAVFSSACMSLEEMAPPIGPDFAAAARGRSVAVAMLEQGRTVYLTDCTRCHSVEPIARYSAVQWEDIVGRMATESNLNESRTQALRAYVLAAHEVLMRRAEAATNLSDERRRGHRAAP